MKHAQEKSSRETQKIIIRKNGTKRVQTFSDLPSKTDQSYKNDCDVNNIMRRFMQTGQVNHLAKGTPVFQDVTEIPDLDVALNTVTKAQETFDALPADIRRRFGNSPVEMYKFISDPANAEQSHKLGLLSDETLKHLAPPSTLAGEKNSTNFTNPNPQKQTKKTNQKASNNDELNDDE